MYRVYKKRKGRVIFCLKKYHKILFDRYEKRSFCPNDCFLLRLGQSIGQYLVVKKYNFVVALLLSQKVVILPHLLNNVVIKNERHFLFR